MSQPAPLDEEEIKNFINENFNLKTDRSLYIKPTYEFISDIYAKFLDELQPCWRQGPKGSRSEPNIKHYMLCGITSVIRKWDMSEPKFNLMDIISPTRKRTTGFLNLLIYIKISVEELKEKIQQKRSEMSDRREREELIEKELQKARIDREDLLIKLANAPSEEKLKRELLDKKSVFQTVELRSKEIEGDAKIIKDSLKLNQESILRKSVEIEALRKETDEIKRRKESIKELLVLREKVAAARSKQDSQSLDIEIEKNKDAAALDRLRTSGKDAIAEVKSRIDARKKEISDINDEFAQIDARKQNATEQCRVYADKLRQRYETLLKKKAESDARTHEYLVPYSKSSQKIAALMGKQDADMSLNISCLANLKLDVERSRADASRLEVTVQEKSMQQAARLDVTYVKRAGE